MVTALRTVSWPLLLWSGLIGLVLSSWTLMVLRKVGMTRYLPRAYWSCTLLKRVSDSALLLGATARLLAMVAVFPIAYAMVFAATGRAEAVVGAVAGAIHGLFAGSLLPIAARRCPAAVAPGFMGWNLGRLTPLALVVVHAVYGAVLGYVYVMPSA